MTAVDTRSPTVRALDAFVRDRVREHRRRLSSSRGPRDAALEDICDLAEMLLARVERGERVGNHVMSGHAVAALVEAARLDVEHPDFEPAWFDLSPRRSTLVDRVPAPRSPGDGQPPGA